MNYILGIDTSNEFAGVFIEKDNDNYLHKINHIKNSHAEFLHLAIQQLIKDLNITLKDIEAFSILNGPGSYTGLRIGLSSIKALCFVTQKPLIAISTLEVYTDSVILDKNDICIASIDARRDEVYMSIFDANKQSHILSPCVFKVSEEFKNLIPTYSRIILIGSGSIKIEETLKQLGFKNILVLNFEYEAILHTFIKKSRNYFNQKKFSKIHQLEPFYLKEAFINIQKKL